VTDKMLGEELDNMLKRLGERTIDEEKIVEGDLVKVSVKELDGKKVKEGGVESEFSIAWEKIADKKLKTSLLKKKTGDTLNINPFKVEEDTEADYVRKYMLGIEDEALEVGEKFEATIIEVSRVEPAEMNQETFDKYFGEGKVTSADEAKALIKSDIEGYYNRQTEMILFRNIQDNLLDKNSKIDLPEAFLKRWLIISDEKNTEELVEAEFEGFAKGLKWSLIKGELNEKFEVKLEEEDIRAGMRARVEGYMQGQFAGNEDFLNSMVDRLMNDEEQVRTLAEEIANTKLFEAVRDAISVKDKSISVEDFQKVVEELNAKNAA